MVVFNFDLLFDLRSAMLVVILVFLVVMVMDFLILIVYLIHIKNQG